MSTGLDSRFFPRSWPKTKTSAVGRRSIRQISRMSEEGLGFMKGDAEFAP